MARDTKKPEVLRVVIIDDFVALMILCLKNLQSVSFLGAMTGTLHIQGINLLLRRASGLLRCFLGVWVGGHGGCG